MHISTGGLAAWVTVLAASAAAARQLWRFADSMTTLVRNVAQLAARLDEHEAHHGRHAARPAR